MAKVYALDSQLIHFCPTDEDEEIDGAPEVYDYFLTFDETTNIEMLHNLHLDLDNHSVSNDTLYYDGQLVTINPPGEYYQDHQYLLDWWTKLNTALDNTDAVLIQTEQAESLWPTLSPQEGQAWLVAHFDEELGGLALVLRVLHGVLRFIRWLIKREGIV